MRDPERIDRIIEKLRKAWKTYPDQRLAQLVSNVCFKGGWRDNDCFHVEDDITERGIDAWLEDEKS